MSDRFANLKKVPEQPAARLLAAANAKLKTPVSTPVSAPVSAVLEALEKESAWVDMIRLISVALPPRECVWWSCVAGRQIVGEDGKSMFLDAAEAWVFEPNDANRAKLQAILEGEQTDDATDLCATAALHAPGSVGTGDLADIASPPGIVSACAFGVNLKTLSEADDVQDQFQLIIDRGLDIARGGNGTIETEPVESEAARMEGEV